MSSVRYGTRLGDLKENWFLLFSNLTHSTHTAAMDSGRRITGGGSGYAALLRYGTRLGDLEENWFLLFSN